MLSLYERGFILALASVYYWWYWWTFNKTVVSVQIYMRGSAFD